MLFGRIPGAAVAGHGARVSPPASCSRRRFFSLIVPAIEVAGERYGTGAIPAAIAAIGVLAGMAVIAWLNRGCSRTSTSRTGREGPDSAELRRIWLFILAITIHNFPEGLAVGVGFGRTGLFGRASAGHRDRPSEPSRRAGRRRSPLLGEGYGRWRSWSIAALTGLVEPVGGALGAAAVSVSEPFLPWGLSFAAGAMLFVISHEIIPETHRKGHQNKATLGLSVGLVLMLFLDVSLG